VATNNVAEYRGLIEGMRRAGELGVRRLTVHGDSKLVIEQMKGAWRVRAEGLRALHDEARVDDALWAALRAEWTEEQLIELIVLAGFYHLISFVTNALRIPGEPYGARFPGMDGVDAAGDGCSRPASPSAGG